MPRVTSSQLQVNQPVEGNAPDATLVVDPDVAQPLAIGSHTFQLEVVDDSGNRSVADQVTLVVADTEKPTAVIRGPRTVPHRQSFTLDGIASFDVGGGRIVKYIWTRLS